MHMNTMSLELSSIHARIIFMFVSFSNVSPSSGNTPLHLAVMLGHRGKVEHLSNAIGVMESLEHVSCTLL